MIAETIFTLIAVVGTIITTAQAFLTAMIRRSGRPFAGGLREQAYPQADSFISILKPVCGLDDELEENLLSFVSLPGVDYEVILSVEDHADAALPVLKTAVRDHPDVFRLVIGGGGTRQGVVNRKVERLIAAARVARGDILLISDSNVRVQPDDVARTIAAFSDARVGCVSNLFTGANARTLGATVESLHLLSFVIGGTILASTAGIPCVVGKSMAISREALRSIGGFEAFRNILAEDQAIGLAVREAGYEVVVSPVAVRNVVVRRTIRRAVDRQVRWNKIRYAFSRSLYASEILLNPMPAAIAAAALGAPAALPLAVVLIRFAQVAILRRAMAAPAPLWAVPLLDALMLYAWFVPFFSNRVTWRGYEARITRNTELVAA